MALYEPDPGGRTRRGAERAAADFVAALRDLVAHRRRRPRDDLVSDLVAAELEADELVGTAALLLMAGHEASVLVRVNRDLSVSLPGSVGSGRCQVTLTPFPPGRAAVPRHGHAYLVRRAG